jgi:hypothetical protein
VTPARRHGADAQALRTDRYVEAQLGARDRHARDVPADADLHPDVRLAARRLAQELVRVHPSFRFEERLAARLMETARGMRPAPSSGEGGAALPVALAPFGDALALDARDLRPLLIRGALTSAALSIAGAAWVAWRRTQQPPRSPMARAVRAAREHRLARRLS